MSENRDAESGQFTASTEEKFGREGVEASHGFTSMPENEPGSFEPLDGIEFKTPREAADFLSYAGPDDLVEVKYIKDGEALPENETVTSERAARDLTAFHNANIKDASHSVSTEFAAAVDAMRKDAVKGDPKAAEHFGIEVPEDGEKVPTKEAKAAKPEAEPSADAVRANSDLDPEVERALKHPQVRQAIEQQLGEAEQVRTSYSAALEAANSFAQATFFQVAPQLEGLPPDQLAQGLMMLKDVDPKAFNAAIGVLGRVEQINQAKQQEQQQREHAQSQEFSSFKASEDAKLARVLGDDHGRVVKEYGAKVGPYFQSLGLTPAEIRGLARDRTIHSAVGQQVLLDAMRYREIKDAPKAVASRSLPPVQRPGTTAGPRASSSEGSIAKLEKQLEGASGLKAARIAAQLTSARRASAR
ncbi:hypothetical protein [Tardiphaga sp. 709]|uniref:hypothetical protein n=1 Tax=Tardiphaga sp. 709 TaxID=3076039 RepID=UPI0028F031AF|nr:hypothetical protein [Tardiphaga sp. 709]WNV10173.1 hypothetical protein RSO67_02970 [Tardiphaga sp. 709]